MTHAKDGPMVRREMFDQVVEERDKLRKLISLEAHGFRDVYWCHNLNEPVIVTYTREKPNEPFCTNCSGPIDEYTHTFLLNVLKPRG